MTEISVYNLKAEKTSQMELSEGVFNVPIKIHVLHQVVVSQLNGKRAGSAATKNRTAVKASGKKLWKQKGSGRARVGDAASPTRRGGGVAFGPTPRSYATKVPKKVRKAALSMALTDKLQSERLVVVEDFSLPEIKTKNFTLVMKNFEVSKALIVTDDMNENLEKSSKNVPGIKVLRYEGLNVYDILSYEHLFMVKSVVNKIEEALVS